MLAPTPPRQPAGGRLDDRYELLRRLDESRTTESWEALDTRLDRRVLVRLLRADARGDAAAEQDLRRVARQYSLDAGASTIRVLDGGDDARLGPFVVAELSEAFEATRPLLVEPPRDYAQPVARPAKSRLGLVVLSLLALVILASAILLSRALLAPVDRPVTRPTAVPTSDQPTRPLSGAQAGQPTAQPTAVPTLAPPPAQATVPATAVPTVSATAPQSSAGSPVDAIRQHYALIDAHNYSAGYQLMDSHLQSLNSPSDYASWFANKVAIQPISVELVSQTDDQATVRSVVASTDRVDGQDVTTQVSEQFVLRKENGAWRIDQVTRL